MLVIHNYHGSALFQALLFAVAAVVAVAMLLGYRTRWATAVSWFLLASLQARNPTLDNGGDNLLRVLMFWAILLPLGERWSIDAARRPAEPRRRVVSVPSFAIQMQLCLVYWTTAILKGHPVWFESYTATEIALSVDHLTTSLGRALLQWPELLRGLTSFTIWLEVIGPALVWIPVWNGPIRFLTVLTFVGFHLMGLAPTLYLGLFPWVCAAAWLVFLPTWMWERLERERPHAMASIDRLFGLLARPLARQGEARHGGAPSPLRRRIEATAAAALLLFVLVWNAATLYGEESDAWLPASLQAVVRTTGLSQQWAMFAPHPPFDDGWYVMPGRTASGREVDVWREAPVSWSKPLDVAASFGHKRWNKYLDNLSQQDYLYHRPLFGEYVCRRWNRDHDDAERLLEFRMILMLERFDAPNEPPRPMMLWAERCDAEGSEAGARPADEAAAPPGA